MNPVTDLMFTLIWFILLVCGIRTMLRGWNLMWQDPNRPTGMWTTQVKKPTHPEMVDVKPGDQLMGVTFDKKPEDPLLQSLQERIEELEEDDDDGDVPSITRK